jgi:PAS domain-containing protein
LQRIAEISPVVMFSIDSEGVLLEANDRWFEMAGRPRNTVYAMSWIDTIMESSVAVMEKGWERLTVDGIPWSAGLVGQTLRQVIFKEQHTDCANLQQLKKPWYDSATGEEVDSWMLAHISPNFRRESSEYNGIHHRHHVARRYAIDAEARAKLSEQLLLRTQEAEELQNKRLKEAEETRRAQHSFIDITSYEKLVEYASSIRSTLIEIQH